MTKKKYGRRENVCVVQLRINSELLASGLINRQEDSMIEEVVGDGEEED